MRIIKNILLTLSKIMLEVLEMLQNVKRIGGCNRDGEATRHYLR